MGVLLHRSHEAGTRLDRAAETQDRLADVDVDGPRGAGQLRELDPGLGDPPGGEVLVDGLGLGVDVAEDLGEAVVHLARDPLALGDHGQLPEARLEVRILDRDRRLVGEGREGLHVVDPEGARDVAADREQPDGRAAALERRCQPAHRPGRVDEPDHVVLPVAARGSDRARRPAPRPQAQVPVRAGEEEHGDVGAEQIAGAADHRLQDPVELGEGGDGDADAMEGAGAAVAGLEGPVLGGELRGQGVDPPERQPRERGGQHEHDTDDEQGVEGDREGDVEQAVADQLDRTDREGRDDDREPAQPPRHHTTRSGTDAGEIAGGRAAEG